MPRGSRTCLDDCPAHSLVGDKRSGRAAAVGGEGVAAARDPREQEGEEGEEDEEQEEKGDEEEQRLQPHDAAPSGCGSPALTRGARNSDGVGEDSKNGNSGDGGWLLRWAGRLWERGGG